MTDTKAQELMNETTRETIRQMMADWNALTPAQRQEAMALAAARARAVATRVQEITTSPTTGRVWGRTEEV
jgi:predicted Fe-S protein YdhL (DUF1289 family)